MKRTVSGPTVSIHNLQNKRDFIKEAILFSSIILPSSLRSFDFERLSVYQMTYPLGLIYSSNFQYIICTHVFLLKKSY